MRLPAKTTLLKMGTVAIWIPIVLQANAAIAGAKIYKIKLGETNTTSQTLEGESYKKIRGRSEWGVLTVNEGGIIQIKQMVRTTQSYGVSTWSDLVVIALNVCPVSNQPRACINLKGDRFTLPKNKSIKDFQFEFQTKENSRSHVRFVQVPADFVAEESPAIDNSRSRSRRK